MGTKAKKQKLTRGLTPPGIAVWPKLQQPDYQFKKEGQYKTGLRLLTEDAETQKLLALLQEEYDKAVSMAQTETGKKKVKLADKPWKDEEDENGNPTGYTIVGFGLKAHVQPKDTTKQGWDQRPMLYDAHLNPLKTTKRISGGSTIRVSFEVAPFSAPIGTGISLRMPGVQILNLVEFDAKSAESLGFTKQEGFDALDSGEEDAAGDAVANGNNGSAVGEASDDADAGDQF